ncbi:AsmA domain-containing protein [Bordetella tumbae]|uniref:AsmA family protein n=1 Tax=Bordetella tumbae TaxID=1649139 RepID=UPI0039EF0674
MTRTKKVLIGLGSVIILVVAALVVAIALFNWNYLKPTINTKVSEAIGRPFAINGDVTVQWRRPGDMPGWQGWVPWPHVVLNDVTLGNPPWGQYRDMASLKRAEFTLSPLPLLTQQVVIREIQLTGARANLERLRDGRTNWLFTFPEGDGQPSKWKIDIDEIGFDQGQIAFRDETLNADIQAQIDPLGKPIPYEDIAGKSSADGKKEDAGKDTKSSAKSEKTKAGEKAAAVKPAEPASSATSPAAQQPAAQSSQAKPSSAQLAAAKAELATKPPASGEDGANATQATNHTAVAVPDDYVFGWKVKGRYKQLPLKGDGKIGGMLAVKDPNRPFPLQADVTIGDTHVAVAGTLTDPANLGALDLRLALSGATMSDLYPLIGVTLPDTPRYATDGRLSARLKQADGATFRYRDFNGKVGASDLHGDLTFKLGVPRPKLTGELSSNQLRMQDLGPLIGVEPNAGKKAAAKGDDKAKPSGGKVLPTQQFRTERWRDMDADVALTAGRIVYDEKRPISKLDVHLVLDNGLLTLDPLRFGFAGGTINSDLKLDGGKTPMTGDAKVAVRGLRLKQLFPNVESMQQALGQLNGDVALKGAGNSVAALLGTSSGDARLLVNDGVISKGLMEIAGLNVGNYVISKLFGDEEVKINCGAADLNMKQGVMTPRVFVFDTENAIVQIEGNVNFKDETLDLDISPESKGIRLFSLRSPLYVKGTFANPDAGVQVLPLAARGAGAVALGVLLTPVASLLALVAPSSGEEEKPCSEMMQQLRQPAKASSPQGKAKSK